MEILLWLVPAAVVTVLAAGVAGLAARREEERRRRRLAEAEDASALAEQDNVDPEVDGSGVSAPRPARGHDRDSNGETSGGTGGDTHRPAGPRSVRRSA